MANRVADDFNRADSTTLGTSSSGHTWTNGSTTTIGIVSNEAGPGTASTDDGTAYLSTSTDFSNVSVQMRITATEEEGTDGWALRFRRSDESNWWEFGMNPLDRTYVLRKMVAGDIFIVSEPGTEATADDLIRVDAYEDRINCYVNHCLVTTVSDSELSTGQNIGIRLSVGAVDVRADYFEGVELLQDIRGDLLTSGRPLADYQVLVDWDNDGGLNFGDFDIDHLEIMNDEENFDGWTSLGSRPATLEISNERVKSGKQCLKATWTNFNLFQFDVSGHGFSEGQFGGDEFVNPPNSFKFNQAGQGFDDGVFAATRDEANPTLVSPTIFKTKDKLVIGREYTLQAWVYVPTDSPAVGLQIEGIDTPVYTTVNDQWEHLQFTYTATATEHKAVFTTFDTNPDTGTYCFIDEIMNVGANEDITCHVLAVRTPLEFRMGRDTARSLASISPAEVEMEVDNSGQLFSPDNPGSLLYGYLSPGKPVVIRATYNNKIAGLFHGFIDNYTLNPNPEELSATFSCIDALQYLSNAKISTALYPSVQTGEAVHKILDEVNWPTEKRKVDHGATTVRWWWVDDEDGLSAVQRLVEAEGLPAIAYVDEFGNFCFESRHHRFLNPRSNGIQATMRSCKGFDEPNFSGPITFDIGWKDIINRVDVEIEERGANEYTEVWSSDDLVVVPAGETKKIKVKASNPFYGATTPTVGYEDVLDNDKDIGKDIVLKTGSGTISTIQLTRDSGQTTELQIVAGATDVTIRSIRIQAFPVETLDTKKVFDEDPTSVELYGAKSAESSDFTWTGINDMQAIARLILNHRSERLPVVNIKLNNGHPIRLSNMLNRRLGDRIHLYEMLQTFMDDDYIIEVIEHQISNSGMDHTTTLGCEKAREQVSVEVDEEPLPVFTFDVEGQGFDDGYFVGGSDFTLSDNLFILDQSRLDEDGVGF